VGLTSSNGGKIGELYNKEA